jgi:DNA-binding transcriptional MerR regulator
MEQVTFMGLDEEWIELILTARNRGLSVEDIRAFLKRDSCKTEELLPVTDAGNKEIC